MSQRKPLRFSHGAIVKLRLKDFMQFSNWVEFRPGPLLNVIVGPNGSGKSSLVNGIALVLGENTGVLGRADKIEDFIRIGCDVAHLEIELFNAEGKKNYSIKRTILRRSPDKIANPRCKEEGSWYLNGEEVKDVKAVRQFCRKLNIQPGNLCQFLPQDKVHDFSKQDPKQLLIKTIEAVGNQELKDSHEILKGLQLEVSNNERLLKVKNNLLGSVTAEYEKLEKDKAIYEERKEAIADIKLLEMKAQWDLTEEAKRNTTVAHNAYREHKSEVDDAEKRLLTPRKKLHEMKNMKQQIENKYLSLKQRKTELVRDAGKIAKRKEEIPDDIENLNGDFMTMLEKEKETEKKLKEMQKQYRDMMNEYQNTQDVGETKRYEKEIQKIQAELSEFNIERENLEHKIRDQHYEEKAIHQEVQRCHRDLDQIGNVAMLKRDTLHEKLPNGSDAVKAMNWLQDNRDHFRGNIHEPILMGIDVQNAGENAIYLENIIPSRDLVAFAAENAEDANKLMTQLRQRMGLRVNVIQVDPNGDPERMRARSGQIKAPDFKGYAKDLFNCHPAVKAYLCRQYQLHNIPIFGPEADGHLNALIQDFQVFFTGNSRHSVVKSSYSGAVSTSSSKIHERGWLNISLDKDRMKQLEQKLKKAEMRKNNLGQSSGEMKEKHKEIGQLLEAKRKEIKQLKEKLDQKKILKGKLQNLNTKIERFRNENKPLNVAEERKKLEIKKEKLINEDVSLAQKITKNLSEAVKVRSSLDLWKSNVGIYEKTEEKWRTELNEVQEEVNKLKETLGELQEDLRKAGEEYTKQLKVAQQKHGDDYKEKSPPRDVAQKWTEKEMSNLSHEEANTRYYTLRDKLEYMETVDNEIVQRYLSAKNSIEVTASDVAKVTAAIENDKNRMQNIRSTWVVALETLIEEISDRFSHFFQHMGYAGVVRLDKGQHEDDFTNYGIEIMVKFRDKYDLQRLDPFKQSGGERSVSTALYMMAMQNLTKVPFRCVDEINQGMDERNERKVFDLLIQTSVRDNSAQYFLLTPKLLHNLHFERGVDVHHVHNGENMTYGKHVMMENFRKVAAKRRRSSMMSQN